MKKSQILAALALAFALGVVAPMTVATPAVYAAVEANTDQKTANAEAVLAAANAVAGEAKYQAYETIATAVSESWAAYNATTDLATINEKIAVVDDEYVAATTISGAISAARDLPNYAEWVALDEAINNTTNPSVDAMVTAAGKVNITITKGDDDTLTISNVKAAVEANDEYKAMKAVITPVEAAAQKVEQENTRADQLEEALKTIGTVDAVDLSNAVNATSPLTELMKLAATANGTNRADAYKDLRGSVAAAQAKDALTATASNANYLLLQAIADDYKTATGNDLSVAGTVIPSDKTEADDKPADKNLPNAGNTGVVAGADATAKATVSIMAAIASVATAAFVAIRKIAAGKKA